MVQVTRERGRGGDVFRLNSGQRFVDDHVVLFSAALFRVQMIRYVRRRRRRRHGGGGIRLRTVREYNRRELRGYALVSEKQNPTFETHALRKYMNACSDAKRT